MNKEDIYISEEVDNRECIFYIIKHYYNIMRKDLKIALEPWKESLKNTPIQLNIILGEYNNE